MDKKLTILVDFDHTLFDTESYVKSAPNLEGTIDYKKFLYPDALEFVKYASNFGNTMLFSEGEVDFQKEKIEGTKIGDLFTMPVKIFPSYSKMDNLDNLNIEGKVVLIDDKPDIIDSAISKGYHVIRVLRGKYSKEDSNGKPDFVVGNLSEIVAKNLLQSF